MLAQTLALYTKEKYDKIWLSYCSAQCMSGLAVWLVGTQVFWAGVLQKTRGPGVTQKLLRINSKFGNGREKTKGESENSSGVGE